MRAPIRRFRIPLWWRAARRRRRNSSCSSHFDVDMTIERFSMSGTPGAGMRPFFASQAAKTKGSYNPAGMADPVIDALVEKVLAADSRADLTVACRAFDRVFRAGRYWVPQWY